MDTHLAVMPAHCLDVCSDDLIDLSDHEIVTSVHEIETADHETETSDHATEIADHEIKTPDHQDGFLDTASPLGDASTSTDHQDVALDDETTPTDQRSVSSKHQIAEVQTPRPEHQAASFEHHWPPLEPQFTKMQVKPSPTSSSEMSRQTRQTQTTSSEYQWPPTDSAPTRQPPLTIVEMTMRNILHCMEASQERRSFWERFEQVQDPEEFERVRFALLSDQDAVTGLIDEALRLYHLVQGAHAQVEQEARNVTERRQELEAFSNRQEGMSRGFASSMVQLNNLIDKQRDMIGERDEKIRVLEEQVRVLQGHADKPVGSNKLHQDMAKIQNNIEYLLRASQASSDVPDIVDMLKHELLLNQDENGTYNLRAFIEVIGHLIASLTVQMTGATAPVLRQVDSKEKQS